MGDKGSAALAPQQQQQQQAMAPRRPADLPGPSGWPVIGSLRQIRARPFHLVLEDWGRQFGSLYRFNIMGRPFVVTSERDTIATLLRERPDLMRRSARTSEIMEELGTRGLFTVEGEEWRKQRKLVMRALTPEVIHNFFPQLSALTERLRLRWQRAIDAGEPVDLLRDLKAYTLDVTIGLAMGHDINTLEHEDNPLQRDIEFIFNRVARRLVTPFPYWRVALLKRDVDHEADAASARIRSAIAGFIAATRERLAAQPALREKPSNMLEALVAARDEEGSGFSDAVVAGNAITMVFAGEDTTSNTMAWLIDLLAQHPQADAAMRAESEQVLGTAPALADYRRLEQMAYIDAATREAMRLKPVAPMLALEPLKPALVGDVLVQPGTIVFCLLRQSAERDSELEEPQQFRPGRWLQPDGERADDPARKLFPFGAGPRFCPGRYLAMAEIKMAMSMLMRNFRLERVAGAPPVQETFTFTVTPDCLPVRLLGRAPAP